MVVFYEILSQDICLFALVTDYKDPIQKNSKSGEDIRGVMIHVANVIAQGLVEVLKLFSQIFE